MTARVLAIFALLAVPTFLSAAEEKVYRTDNAVVNYSGIEENQAQAIARITGAARKLAIDKYGFDMPEIILVNVDARATNTVRLFNDGRDRFSLSLRSAEGLAKPATSGTYHVYGLCHEVGHLAMYRPIARHDWMTSAAAEGWAHYLGSRLVDDVFAAEGEKAWCDPYDYRADGTRRMEAQLAAAKRAPLAEGAALWKELAGIVGDKQIAPIFKAWGEATIDSADPGAALRSTLLATNKDARLTAWWNKAEPVMVFRQPKSDIKARTATLSELSGKPVDLARDDGKSAGQSSIAGGGHAVLFDAPGDGWFLSDVRIYGSRYGYPQPPRENFSVWLLDEEGKTIREFSFPYGSFARGQPKWVKLVTAPTEVPRKFVICVGFNPTGTKGVFVHYDAAADGDSRTGLPGQLGKFDKGDWMIRVSVDQLKAADPLKAAP